MRFCALSPFAGVQMGALQRLPAHRPDNRPLGAVSMRTIEELGLCHMLDVNKTKLRNFAQAAERK